MCVCVCVCVTVCACATVDRSDVERHLKRYTMYDTSQDAKDGIPLTTALSIPEFASNPLYPRILQIFIDAGAQRLYADRFLQLCALLSSSMPAAAKKQCTVAFIDHVYVCIICASFKSDVEISCQIIDSCSLDKQQPK